MRRHRGRKAGLVGLLWLPGGAGAVKLVASGLVVALVAGAVVGDSTTTRPPGGGSATAHGPEQRWGTAADSATAGHTEGKPANRTLPDTLRGRYPRQVWEQKVENTAAEVEAPAPEHRGFDAATSTEIPEARTEYERTYANTDGTETTEFSGARLNYRDRDGKWVPIDTRLVGDPGKGWHNAADEVDVRVAPKSGADELVTLTVDDDHSVSYTLAGATASAGAVDGSTVTYAGVRPKVDLKLESLPGGVKETLVLAAADAPTSFTFPLRLQNLTPRVDGGQVVFTDAAGAQRAVIPPGSMVDANGATSTAVSYRLSGTDLELTVDPAWLRDPARAFPVAVDPTVKLPVTGEAADMSMYVRGGTSSPGGDEFATGPDAAAYVRFGNLVERLRNHTIFGAQLWVVNFEAESCTPRPVTVHPVTGSWDSQWQGGYPGPAVGGALASRSFAHGYIAFGESSSACPTAGELFNLGAGGRDLVQRWVNGEQANNGLSLRGPGRKKFVGPARANPPKLYVTHSPYNATYKLTDPRPNPPVLQNQDGKVKVTVTNKSAEAWSQSGYYLAYRAYKADSGASVVQQRAANLPASVPRNGKVTLEATIKALPPGKYFLDFTMVKAGGPVFTDHQVPPARVVLQVFDIPPVVQELFPVNGYQAPTLTPQLWARALDVDAPPSSSLQFKFEICERDPQDKPVNCVNSGYQAKTAWTPAAGALSWSKAYKWRAFVKDATTEVASPYSTLLTHVPQPEVTSRVSSSPLGLSEEDFDPQTGNYTTAAVDATVTTVGPQLTVTRTYNSLDPRRDGMFGAGWTSGYDVELVPDDDGSGNVVVTYPDGQAVRFGRNADGTYAAPSGRVASLTADSTSWKLLDKSGTTYQFAPTGRLTRITDVSARSVVLSYGTDGRLTKAQVSNSQTNTAGRALSFTWTGNHVTAVRTDPLNGTPLTWTYKYTGDVLNEVCAPGATACTTYGYTAGSHYRSTVLDGRPESYWRLGESEGTQAGSEVAVNLGKDTATYKNAALGTTGPLAGTSDTAATFNGTSSTVELPKGALKKSRDGAVELWFRNNPTGSGGPLLGYQDKALGTTPTTGVPVLYVGTDGKLRGQFAGGSVAPITSATAVNDGKWHHAVLSSMGSTQTLYLDGAEVGEATGRTVDHTLLTFNQLGAAHATGTWPAWGSTPQRFYNGSIDEVALYAGPLGPAQVAAHHRAGTAQADQLAEVVLPSKRVGAAVKYDVGLDRVKEYTDDDGGTWRVGAPTVFGGDDDLRRSVEVLDPANRTSLYEFDALGGRLLRFGLPLGLEARSEDAPGEPVPTPGEPVRQCSKPDPDDPAFCTVIPDDSGGPVFVRYGVDGVSIRSFGYDEDGTLKTVTDENGDTTTMTHDARGNVTSRKTCRTDAECHTSYTTYPATVTNRFDPRNDQPVETRDGRSAGATDNTYLTRYTYHPSGQLASQTGPDGSSTSSRYTTGAEPAVNGGNPPAGLLESTTNARGKTTRYAYFANGDLARVTTPAGLVTEFGYDALGRLTSQKEISDSFPAGVSSTFTYDAASRPLVSTGPVTTNAVTGVKHQQRVTNTYDEDGNLTRVETADALGNDPARVTTTTYDEHGRPRTVTDAEGNETHYEHDDFGNVTSRTDPNGNRYDYAYTARNSLAEVRLRNWRSDPPGAPALSRDHLVLNSYSYDFAGRLASTTDAMGRRTEYQYYDDGLLKRTVLKNFHDPDGTTRDFVLEENTYDGAGNPVRQVVDNGRTVVQNTVDRLGRVEAAVLDPGGLARTNAFTYDGNGNIKSVTMTGKPSNVPWAVANDQQKVTYDYDDDDNVVQETVFDGAGTRVTRTAYDRRGLPVSETDARGLVAGADPAAFTTRAGYDELGQLVTATGAPVAAESGGNPATTVTPTVTTGYDTFGGAVDVKDELGQVSRTTYDRLGRVVSAAAPSYQAPGATQAVTPTTVSKYDGNSNVVEVVDPRGNVSRSTYDQLNRLVEVDVPGSTNDERAVTSYTYTRSGRVLSTTDPLGARTEATYDDLDRQVTATRVERRPAAAAFTTRHTYDDAGNAVTTAAPTGATTTNTYDALNQLVKVVDPNSVQLHLGYDFAGQRVRVTDGLGRTDRTTYNQYGEEVAETSLKADGTALRGWTYGRDQVGNVISVTDPNQVVETYAFDAANRLVRQTEPVADGRSVTTSFGFDAAGNRTRYTDGRGNSTITTYNTLGLPESTVDPATAAHPNAADRTWTVGYDAAGNPVSLTAPGGVGRKRVYDAANRASSETGTGAESATVDRTYGYDLADHVTRVSAPGGTDTYDYDDRGNLLATSGPSGTSQFRYDGDGNPSSRQDAAGTTAFTFTKGRLVATVDGITGATQRVGYDAAGMVKTLDYGAGRVRTLGYDDLGRLTSDVLTNAAKQAVASTGYTFNPDDTVATKTTAGVAGAGQWSYGYDKAGRLTGTTFGGTTTAYDWDDAGNRVKAGGKVATYDERNRLLSDGDNTYTYSARGTLRSRTGASGTTRYSFDAFDRMTGAGALTYTYDGFDRVATRNSTRFSYAGLADEVVSDGAETYARGAGDELLATARGTTERLALQDAHGDVVAAFDPADSTLAALPDSTGYDPFGKVTGRTGNTGSLGFQGDWTDQSSGQVDMGVRWYDPATGGFASRDSADTSGGSATGANRYAYGSGDPVANADPTGHFGGPIAPPRPKPGTKSGGGGGGGWSWGKLWGGVKKGAGWGWRAKKFVSPWNAFWSVMAPTPLGDSSCTGRYGVTCDVYFSPGFQANPPSVHQQFCDTHSWTKQCGGSGRFPYPIGGTRVDPGTGAGGGGGPGGGPGGSGVDAAAAAAAAALAAYLRAKAISDQARADNARVAKNNPIAVNPAATQPVLTMPKPVSSTPKSPATKVGTIRDVVDDVKADTDAIYQAAVRRAGQVQRNVSTAAQVSPSGSPAPQPGTGDDDDDGDCRSTLPTPDYKPLDKKNGNRATGVEACLVLENLTKGSAPSVYPPGFRWAQATAGHHGANPEVKFWINRCHLLGSQFGGTGADTRNLSTCSRTANANANAPSGRDRNMARNMLSFENDVMAAVRRKQIIEYEVTPVYLGKRTVPVAYKMSAEGVYRNGNPGINLHETIPNSMYSPKYDKRVNLGTIVHEKQQAPMPGVN
ncbi:RHS repeat-associated core domain-containing protein [Saccharothrix syringae]|uniref:DNRLRE domain-containing protein n=1 Tax=Saccharothrix syringae TaxID=103733 RepID=A0A5Q0GZM9_SACSY|nr:LamG-like jellyroll fold domain-containing protein [Saccharothrix syringae]QFZ19014.1 hypothetical protein EKG83_17535 [Saccharothrix syringae]